jgi:hypothetical protein
MAKLPKWPKKPRKSAGLATWNRYEERVKAVAAKRKAIKEAPKKKEAIARKVESLKMKG